MTRPDAEAHLAACQEAHSIGYTNMRLGVEYGPGPYDDDDLDWHYRNGWWSAVDGTDD